MLVSPVTGLVFLVGMEGEIDRVGLGCFRPREATLMS
jgi:hypothetical protein